MAKVHLPDARGRQDRALCETPVFDQGQVTMDVPSVTCGVCCVAMLEYNAQTDRVLLLALRAALAEKAPS